MLPILSIGPLALPLAPLILLLSVWAGLEIMERHARRLGVDANALYNVVLIAMLAGVIGARLGYAAQAPQAFMASPLALFALQPQMFDLPSGLLVAVLAGWIAGQRKHLPLWRTLDGLTSLAAVFAVGLGFANLASGDGFGAPTTLAWGIRLWGDVRHPTQIYEIIAAAIILLLTLPRSSQAAGSRFWTFIALSAGAKIFLEGFRGDSILIWDQFRLAQIIAWVVFAVGLWQLGLRFRKTSTVEIK